MRLGFLKTAVFTILFISFICQASRVFGQHAAGRSYRDAFGEPRASLMESLLAIVYPNVAIKWGPTLMIELSPGKAQRVQFPGFVFKPLGNTSLIGATGIEVGDEKAKLVFQSSHFQQTSSGQFPSLLVVFLANLNGQVTSQKKMSLDPSDPLSEIKLIQVGDSAAGTWPFLTVQYVSHVTDSATATDIEWQALFDPNTGKVVRRVPSGIHMRSKDRKEALAMLKMQRVDASTVSFMDLLTKKTFTYSCADPCIVDGPTLLATWSHR